MISVFEKSPGNFSTVLFPHCLIRLLLYAGICIGLHFTVGPVSAQLVDNPPTTTIESLDGVPGSNGWYVSHVDAQMSVTDEESVPDASYFQVNGQPVPPEEIEHIDIANPIVNPSFEDGWILGIDGWTTNYGVFNPLAFQLPITIFGLKSAGTITVGEHYWTNKAHYVPVTSGVEYTSSVWIELNLLSSAWYEVWLLDSSGQNPELLAGTSPRISTWLVKPWAPYYVTFTVPEGYDGAYFRLYGNGIGGFAYFDNVNLIPSNTAYFTIPIRAEGENLLSYYSIDNYGNVEPTKESIVKIDTVRPGGWGNFEWNQSGSQYQASATVRDVTSGIQTSSAEFRSYNTDCLCWGSWQAVNSITQLQNGSGAIDGYTQDVKLSTGLFSAGSNSAAVPRVEFRIRDMASHQSSSSVYYLSGSWVHVGAGGNIYSYGGIHSLGVPPPGQFTTTGYIAGYGPLIGVSSSHNWILESYEIPEAPSFGLEAYIPGFLKLREQATVMTSNTLPDDTGVYLYNGNFVVNQSSIGPGVENGTYGAVIIIEGDLSISADLTLGLNAALVFLVNGDVEISPEVTESSGFIIATGDITTGASTEEVNGSLTHAGGLLSTSGIHFERALNASENSSTPTEFIDFPVHYYLNRHLIGLLNYQASFQWQEVD